MKHVLNLKMDIPAGIEEVFGFISDIGNLERVTPPDLDFTVITPRPVAFAEGTIFDYRLRMFGFPLSWRSQIKRFEPPNLIIDEQLSGPYKLWLHMHYFREADGMTSMVDEIHYELPLSPFGDVALPLVHRELQRIFQFRSEVMFETLTGGRP
jgi:ligand-binding SRPBCC domain-containing protein